VDPAGTFDYDNLTGRPTSLLVTVASRLIPGVGLVQRQVKPYARAWRTANLTALTHQGPRWLVLGDSMSLGIGASQFNTGWVNQVHNQLTADGLDYNIINLSASGARVDDVLNHQLPALRALPPRTDADPRPDIVTLLIGSNDLMRKKYREQLPAKFKELLQALPAGTIVANLPNPRSAAMAANDLISSAVAAGRITLADVRSGRVTSWKGKLAEDHFHPNDAGYAGLARTFYRTITTTARTKAKGSR
jgi:lysophospholipase L1-like esterase